MSASFDPVTAATRFGTGLSPLGDPPASASEMIAALTGPDLVAAALPIPPYAQAFPAPADFQDVNRRRNEARKSGDADALARLDEDYRALLQAMRDAQRAVQLATLARGVAARDGLRERLTRFWADHFTVRATGVAGHLVAPFVEEAIRPHVAGRFADMLIAVTTHPMMLLYLDQVQSRGPNSPAAINAARRGTSAGLNENLARELLELHTLGVDGPYSQGDVRELAELLTGLTHRPQDGFFFEPRFAEPGSETVLGVTYGEASSLETVLQALRDLAAHPGTTRYVGRKLAVHFVSSEPDPDLVATLAATFEATGGDLGAVTAALLEHPASWVPARDQPGGLAAGKVKPPFDFVQSALRALGVAPDRILALDLREAGRLVLRPLAAMGQAWEAAPGPDGWPEAAAQWVTPHGMAARIDWAMRVPERLAAPLPDPRDLVRAALGPEAPAEVVFAAGAAETRAEGVGVVLASAAFQRR